MSTMITTRYAIAGDAKPAEASLSSIHHSRVSTVLTLSLAADKPGLGFTHSAQLNLGFVESDISRHCLRDDASS